MLGRNCPLRRAAEGAITVRNEGQNISNAINVSATARVARRRPSSFAPSHAAMFHHSSRGKNAAVSPSGPTQQPCPVPPSLPLRSRATTQKAMFNLD